MPVVVARYKVSRSCRDGTGDANNSQTAAERGGTDGGFYQSFCGIGNPPPPLAGMRMGLFPWEFPSAAM